MVRPQWLRAPSHLVALFATVILLPAIALVWLAWLLLEQDRVIERQQQFDLLERRADRISTGLQQELDALQQCLPALLTSPPAGFETSGAVVLRLTRQGLAARAGAPLLYVPTVTSAVSLPEDIWAPGELLELRHEDLAGAASAFKSLTASDTPGIRAGSFLRLARVRRKQGQVNEAIAAYQALASQPEVSIQGEPAALRARRALCALLAESGRRQELVDEAAALARDLSHGRWAIDRSTYEFYAAELKAWTDVRTSDPDTRVLTAAVDAVWREAFPLTGGDGTRSGRRSLWIEGQPVLLVSQQDAGATLALAATSTYLDKQLGDVWRTQGASVLLTDADGHHVLGPPDLAGAVRTGPEVRLPWTLRIASGELPTDLAASAAQRRGLLASLALAAIVLIAGSGAFVIRAVQRELAVARLQADFVSAVSHEFRTPLTSLTHLVAILRGASPPPEARRQEYYEVFARETDRLRRFVETLLDFGRLEAGAATHRLDRADPSQVIGDLVSEFQSDVAVAGHTIAFRAEDELSAVRIDREALGRAIWNLVENAAKYSPPGAPIEVSLRQSDRHVEIRVADRGAGIPAAELPRIFRKFYRGAAAHASAVKGTGVGLAMVRHIVTAHGGDVRVESEVGHGSTFTIALPRVGPREAQAS